MATITKAMSDTAIAGELYARLEARRKSMSFTQEDMAKKLGITPKSYRALETGTCRLTTFIATLRHLDLFDNLDKMISPMAVSPLEALTTMQAVSIRPALKIKGGRLSESQTEAKQQAAAIPGTGRRTPSEVQENPILARRQKLVVKG